VRALILLLIAMPALATEHVVTQAGLQFGVDGAKADRLAIKPGDTVVFRNDDRFAHTVFSRSNGQAFDLGLLRPGASAQRRFATPGMIEVECAMHPQMKLRIEVAR